MATKIRVFPRNAVIDRRIFKTEKTFKYLTVPSAKIGVKHNRSSVSVHFSELVKLFGFMILKQYS